MTDQVQEKGRLPDCICRSHRRSLDIHSRGRCQRGIARSDILLVVVVMLMLLLVAEFLLRAVVVRSALLDPKTDAYWEQLLRERTSDPILATRRDEGDIVHDTQLGWRMRPNYASPLATHDAVGYRRTSRPGAPSVGTIVVLGDSFTYGLGVGDDETYASHLARQTSHEVVNMGVNAYGADQALLLWEKEGVSTEPDLVVLGYFVDDFYRNALTVRDGPKPFFRLDGAAGSLVLNGVPVPNLEQYVVLAGRHKTLAIVDVGLYVAGRVRSRLGIPAAKSVHEKAELSKYILMRLRDSVETSGASLVILIIGHCYDQIPEYLLAEATIERHCEVLDLECLNIAKVMRAGDYLSYYGENCHWSADGHIAVAKLVAELSVDQRR